MANKKKTQIHTTWRLDVAKSMPPLRHSIAGEKFDMAQSEAAKWLVSQPDILQLVFNAVRNRGYIVYDSGTGLWRGSDYED